MTGEFEVLVGAIEPPTVMLPPLGGAVGGLRWLENHQESVRAALRTHSSLYLAGAGITNTENFARARDIVFRVPAAYREKATPRTDFGADIYSSTDLPAGQPIRQHNENSYTLSFPGKLLFGCLAAPTAGGATTVADVRAVLASIDAGVCANMARTGWQLTRNYQNMVGLPWQTAFGTADREEVDRYCAANQISCTWRGDVLTTRQVRSGIIRHPETGQRSWFNHASFWSEWSLDEEVRDILLAEFGDQGLPFSTAYGDGAELSRTDVENINAAYERHTRRRAWQPGDLLLVDNLLSSHGRDAFEGERNIVVAMGDPVELTAYADQPIGVGA